MEANATITKNERAYTRPAFDGMGNRATVAIVECGNVQFAVTDPFSVYLAEKQNAEMLEYLAGKAEEIRRFLAAIEARVAKQ
jgi:hypothetical protein